MDLEKLIHYVITENCSDLHLSAGEKPMIRKVNDLVRLDEPELSSDDMQKILETIATTEQREILEKTLELDFSYTVKDVARFRVNAFYQARGLSLALRRLSFKTPTLEEVKLTDPIFKKLCHFENGLILITGATGSGKSTTLAAFIDYINHSEELHEHILTIEDPIEYVFTDDKCLIQQREIGRDTKDFQGALRAALREDPDVIMVGEMRDLETIRLALTAAETGHLVFGTLHTSSAPHAIDRIIDVFPGVEKDMIRSMLSGSLRAVVAQRLLKTPKGDLYPAHEILTCTGAVRNLIREDKIPQLYSAMQTGRQYGMITMEQRIEELLEAGIISPLDTAADSTTD